MDQCCYYGNTPHLLYYCRSNMMTECAVFKAPSDVRARVLRLCEAAQFYLVVSRL